jgi:hypothetical protein
MKKAIKLIHTEGRVVESTIISKDENILIVNFTDNSFCAFYATNTGEIQNIDFTEFDLNDIGIDTAYEIGIISKKEKDDFIKKKEKLHNDYIGT